MKSKLCISEAGEEPEEEEQTSASASDEVSDLLSCGAGEEGFGGEVEDAMDWQMAWSLAWTELGREVVVEEWRR